MQKVDLVLTQHKSSFFRKFSLPGNRDLDRKVGKVYKSLTEWEAARAKFDYISGQFSTQSADTQHDYGVKMIAFEKFAWSLKLRMDDLFIQLKLGDNVNDLNEFVDSLESCYRTLNTLSGVPVHERG